MVECGTGNDRKILQFNKKRERINSRVFCFIAIKN